MKGKIDPRAVPGRGKSNLYGGCDPIESDGKIGDWDRQQLEKMQLRFASAMQRELQPSPGKPQR